MSASEPGRVLGTGRPDAPPSLQRRCSEDTWQSPGVRYGVGKLPATESGQCAAEPPLSTGWSLVQSPCASCLTLFYSSMNSTSAMPCQLFSAGSIDTKCQVFERNVLCGENTNLFCESGRWITRQFEHCNTTLYPMLASDRPCFLAGTLCRRHVRFYMPWRIFCYLLAVAFVLNTWFSITLA